jgi:hypothetical protein
MADKDILAVIEFCTDLLVPFQAALSPDERLDLWNKIMVGYCPDCARSIKSSETCLCENDE